MKKFFVGVKAVIRDSQGRVLLVRRAARDVWECPGGRIDDAEQPEQTLLRELQEELPEVSKLQIGSQIGFYRLGVDIEPGVDVLLTFYKVQASLSDPVLLSEEHSAYGWFTQDEADSLLGLEHPLTGILRAELQSVS